jgi:hypothetical protein
MITGQYELSRRIGWLARSRHLDSLLPGSGCDSPALLYYYNFA